MSEQLPRELSEYEELDKAARAKEPVGGALGLAEKAGMDFAESGIMLSRRKTELAEAEARIKGFKPSSMFMKGAELFFGAMKKAAEVKSGWERWGGGFWNELVDWNKKMIEKNEQAVAGIEEKKVKGKAITEVGKVEGVKVSRPLLERAAEKVGVTFRELDSAFRRFSLGKEAKRAEVRLSKAEAAARLAEGLRSFADKFFGKEANLASSGMEDRARVAEAARLGLDEASTNRVAANERVKAAMRNIGQEAPSAGRAIREAESGEEIDRIAMERRGDMVRNVVEAGNTGVSK